jgi:hypothetical protein
MRGHVFECLMLRASWVLVLAMGCTEVANPAYCDENSDCRNGTVCNLDTHGCEMPAQGDAAPEDGAEPDDGPYVARTIQEVRAATTPVNTPVELADVIVTAIDRYGTDTGDVWVQEIGGGPSSGVHVYSVLDADVALLAVGDVIDINNARKVTFTAGGDTTGKTEIEVAPTLGGSLVITRKSAMAVYPTTVDILAIEALAQPYEDIEIEKWVGMLVRFTQVRANGSPTTVGLTNQFPLSIVNVNDTQVALPSGVVNGTCFDEIIGILEYYRTYNLVPRQESDAFAGGTSCP